MNKIVYTLLLFVFIKLNVSFAQDERLVPLTNNPTLINEWKRINAEKENESTTYSGLKIQSAINDTLLLPFIDDFSLPTMFPRNDLWKDSAVFINRDFPIHPPTIGVATFDGLNRFGNPYYPTGGGTTCDTLTSKPINTFDDGSGNQYDTAAGLFFSFFYEQTGHGDQPEAGEYLLLQFLDNNGTWHDADNIPSIPSAQPAGPDTTFTRVQITINDPVYFYKGFRFRFRNFGSTAGNIDHWHIDYVKLTAPPNIPNLNDVAYVTPGHSLLNDLTAMPYTHYKIGAFSHATLMADNLSCEMHNNDTFDKICRFVDTIYDPSGTGIFCNGCIAGSNNHQIYAHSSYNYPFPFQNFEFPSYATSTAAFDVVNNIESTSGVPLDDNAQNDTIHYLQKFYNYYAHDDGTAEAGYNLTAAGASLAYKFHINKADTLHAIQFYFTRIGPSVANELFTIKIWYDSGGVPGGVAYQKVNQVSSYTNIIDGFFTYTMPSPPPLPAGYYYFGYTQNNNVQLNLGFDANILTPASEKYYKTGSSWAQSSIAGSWMIRPVFTPYPFNVGENIIAPVNALSVYPNPASDVIHVDYDFNGKTFRYELYDASGRVVVSNKLLSNTIDVANISNGFYVLRIADDDKKNLFQEKLIVHH